MMTSADSRHCPGQESADPPTDIAPGLIETQIDLAAKPVEEELVASPGRVGAPVPLVLEFLPPLFGDAIIPSEPPVCQEA